MKAALFSVFYFGAVFATAAEPVAISGRTMGTTWAVKYTPPTEAVDSNALSQRIVQRLEQLERQFSTYRPDSEISRFNAAIDQTDWVAVSPELAQLMIESRRISELTGGAFDVTVDPLVRLWGFGPKGRGAAFTPKLDEVARTRARVGWRSLEGRAEGPALRRLQPGITADFSSIAKGYSSDALGELLSAGGIRNYFVQVGGDVKTGGHRAGNTPWSAGIETPAENARAIACIVELVGEALSTSGDYRNFVRHEGRRYGHIIDPRTGAPVEGPLAAVSVVHESCATSSALATALFVLGPEGGLSLARERHLACAFFVRTREATVFERRATPEFMARIQ